MTVTIHKAQDTTDQDGASAVRAKVARLMMERKSLLERLIANSDALLDAVAAGRLFNVEIELPADIRPASAIPHKTSRMQGDVQPSLFEPSGDLTIRGTVLDLLKKAGEEGARAAKLRKTVETMMGRELHFKTIGMTLYRLSEKGLVRRQGTTWYYVPQGDK